MVYFDCSKLLQWLQTVRKPGDHSRSPAHSNVGWRFPSLIAKVIVDYDYSQNCNRLRLTITLCLLLPVQLKCWVLMFQHVLVEPWFALSLFIPPANCWLSSLLEWLSAPKHTTISSDQMGISSKSDLSISIKCLKIAPKKLTDQI